MSTSPLSLWQVLKEEYESSGLAGRTASSDTNSVTEQPTGIDSDKTGNKRGDWSFTRDQLFDPMSFWINIEKAQDLLSVLLKNNLSAEARKNIEESFRSTKVAAEKSEHEDSSLVERRRFLKNELLDAQDKLGDLLSEWLNTVMEQHDIRLHCDPELVKCVSLKPVVQVTSTPDESRLYVKRFLLEEVYAAELKPLDAVRVSKFYEQIHKDAATSKNLRSAVCLSGGGIRSATFNLGILQGLARHGLLDKFDYLSTVSGGGFIGSWLTAWIHRRGLEQVIDDLTDPPKSPLDPEPEPINHLRVYSNFLSPQPGLLSADTWTLISSVLRNLLLTWLVFVPWFGAALLLPRAWVAVVARTSSDYIHWNLAWSAGIAFVAALWAFTYIGMGLPTANIKKASALKTKDVESGQRRFILYCLLPMVIAAMSFAIYWARLREKTGTSFGLRDFIFIAEAVVLLPWVLIAVKIALVALRQSGQTELLLLRLAGATFLIALAQLTTGCLLWYAFAEIVPDPVAISNSRYLALSYATLAVPIVLLALGISGTLVAGFTSRFTDDDDQEWWARAGAWVLIAVVVWSALHLLVLYGPLLVLGLGDIFRSDGGGFQLETTLKLLGTLVGVISGVITLTGGFSATTPANEKEAKEAGLGGKLLFTLTSFVAPLFFAFLVVLITLGTNFLILPLADIAGAVLPESFRRATLDASPFNHIAFVHATPFRYLLAAFVLMLLVGFLMGRLINTNRFSLHFMWRNRIIRAYLGASRRARQPDELTGFDTLDNLQMHELREPPSSAPSPIPIAGREAADAPHMPLPRKLFHVINIALNLTGGNKLAWQDRKAESFTVSPLHCGSYWLGYRRASEYGGENGISLGTAVAISGAFVSPNMGYMMTSPVIRFLMTLFNVRFGWWLGNPGAAGERAQGIERVLYAAEGFITRKDARPFQLKSPRLSVLPIVHEATGHINDKSSYVYLSDGGHFENLGLYEMVLRRCRFIVISDASTDASYSFDSLAASIRQIRVDLGVPIEISDMAITSPSQDMKGKYCAVGTIRYSCVDRDVERCPEHRDMKDEHFDGTLIYIKASVIGDEPRDVINYGQESSDFPQEVIVDQWFSEAQFESYRALGSHIVDVICADPKNAAAPDSRNTVDFSTLKKRAEAHNKINFHVFKERASYAAFEEAARKVSVESYRDRVNQYMDDLLK